MYINKYVLTVNCTFAFHSLFKLYFLTSEGMGKPLNLNKLNRQNINKHVRLQRGKQYSAK